MVDLKNSLVFTVGAFVGGGILWSASVLSATQDILVAVGLKKPSALVLAEDSARSRLSETFIDLAWARLYWAKDFVNAVADGAPAADIDDRWRRYVEAAADWSRNELIFIVGIDRYYGEAKSRELEFGISDFWVRMDTLLRSIRTKALAAKGQGTGAYSGADDGLAEAIETYRYEANVYEKSMYYFVRCFHPGSQTEGLACDDTAMRAIAKQIEPDS